MYFNGFIIQEHKNNLYKGIDGSGFSEDIGQNWYLNYNEVYQSQFLPYYEKDIEKSDWVLEPHTWLSVCTDLDYIYRYIAISKEIGIKYRVLLVRTEIPAPIINGELGLETCFLGYDYAYENGDNYSAVYNEVPTVFPQFKLNENGLFQTKEEIQQYIFQREKYERTHAPYTLEKGNFVVFEVYEVDL